MGFPESHVMFRACAHLKNLFSLHWGVGWGLSSQRGGGAWEGETPFLFLQVINFLDLQREFVQDSAYDGLSWFLALGVNFLIKLFAFVCGRFVHLCTTCVRCLQKPEEVGI